MDESGRRQDRDRRLKAERRAWIATHHPDHGGDPAAFADGLAAFDAAGAAVAGSIEVYRSRSPLRRVRRWVRRRRRGTQGRRVL